MGNGLVGDEQRLQLRRWLPVSDQAARRPDLWGFSVMRASAPSGTAATNRLGLAD
jgi:hypothetical protein